MGLASIPLKGLEGVEWLERLDDKIALGDGCWNWKAARRSPGGYGVFWLKGRNVSAHRVLYELFKGPIPPGLEIDHLCRNKGCVRPDHLEAVSQRVNTLRSDAQSAKNARKVECHRGHPLSGDNLYVNPRGERQCRECQTAAGRRYLLRNRKERVLTNA